MKQLLVIWTFVLIFIQVSGTAFAQAQYQIDGVNPFYLIVYPLECETVTVAIDPGGTIANPLITAGFWLSFDPTKVYINSSAAYDGSVSPNLWDPGFTGVIDEPAGPGTWFITVGNFATVPIGDLRIVDVELCTLTDATGLSTVICQTIPGFDTVVGDTTVWDQQITPDNNGIIDVNVVVPPCVCDLTGPSEVQASAFDTVTAQYTVTAGSECGQPSYEWSDDCGLGDVDQTGLLTVPATTVGETCTITVVDLANTDINTGAQVTCEIPIEIIKGDVCQVEIAKGRECPGEEIDDPAYNRPGRRGLVATCGDIIDFTACEDCVDDSCLEWTIEPAVPWMTIQQIDDCCWRLTIGDNCDQLTKTQEFEVIVTDPCNNDTSDSIILEVGKVVIDLGDTAVNPESGTADVTVDLINPDHHVRALSFDVVGMGPDNLECTACTADPNRALQFTCSAAEQPDGSCRVIMYSTNPAALIAQGAGQVATILYDAIDPAAGDCVSLMPINEQSSDQFNEDLCTCGAPGEVCFKTCGDIYPQDCLGGDCASAVCGDGVVDLFDILEAIDIILGLQIATDCQLDNADVPNGMPPYCGDPPGDPNCQTDGDVDIFDVLVMIDKALGKTNCCDYCNFGNIF